MPDTASKSNLPSNSRRSGPPATMGVKRSWIAFVREWFWVTSAVVLILAGALGLIYFQASYVSGTEFNPITWEIRDFAYRRDPFTHRQLVGITHATRGELSNAARSAPSAPLVDAVIASHFRKGTSSMPPANNTSSKWDLVEFAGFESSRGKASILVDLVEATDPSFSDYWTNWTNENPKKAAVFWPAIQDLVSCSMYAHLPDLFELALGSDKPDQFKESLDAMVETAFATEHELLLKNGDEVEAAKVAEVARLTGKRVRSQ